MLEASLFDLSGWADYIQSGNASLLISLAIAFLAGLISFLSPCVLPIIPGYIAYISGLSATALQEKKGFNPSILISAIAFVLGFSLIFTLMGAGSTFIGNFLFAYKKIISEIAGVFIVILGLHFTGIFQHKHIRKILTGLTIFIFLLYLILSVKSGDFMKYWFLPLLAILLNIFYFTGIYKILYQQKNIEIKTKRLGVAGAFLIGMAFAFGWSPCIGPILSAILMYASQQENVQEGMLLLFSYSMGLGIPFILTAVAINMFFKVFRVISKYFLIIEIIGGLLLIFIGILLMFNKLSMLSF
jgi:cytochrome c-type biogenesis protein